MITYYRFVNGVNMLTQNELYPVWIDLFISCSTYFVVLEPNKNHGQEAFVPILEILSCYTKSRQHSNGIFLYYSMTFKCATKRAIFVMLSDIFQTHDPTLSNIACSFKTLSWNYTSVKEILSFLSHIL